MYKDKRILCVIPARGGSKGIKYKNLMPIQGVPLVVIAGKLALEIDEIDRCVVSTDSEKISKVAQESGIDVPFFRPRNISSDSISDWDVLIHALEECEKIDQCKYDIILMLQPTSPLRKKFDVLQTIKKLIDEDYDSVWTVSETDSKSHPLKQLILHNGQLNYWDQRGKEIIARQQLDKVLHRNGVAYAISRYCLVEQKTIMGKKTGSHEIEDFNISIDTMDDVALIEWHLSKK
jgi:CMP-N,N'-diacetyllegionaminic acid synthase|tara:strand:- start:800 stop:1501 length:702 start_codon:yes stop_codon:yes gene_type:complete